MALTFAPRRLGQELRTQADSQHRQFGIDGLADPTDLVGEPRVNVDVVHVHRSAEHDQPGRAAEPEPLGHGVEQIDVAPVESGVEEDVLEDSQRFARDVAQYRDSLHEILRPGSALASTHSTRLSETESPFTTVLQGEKPDDQTNDADERSDGLDE